MSHGNVKVAGRGGINLITDIETVEHWGRVQSAVMKAAIMQQEGAQLDDGYFVPAVHCQPKDTNAARNAAASASTPTQSNHTT
ncbi:hypothetical protein CPLU01_09958 [Colletotrichum plurivorum]|uniref:Uncharacterized protein n=1 Tax=Colletotrichum plurivorum TaxID=2175906 RepID=A0A8H6K7P2_9PEZI|nr:hypothetical protein CPLU01_09958 [Colletotrichum plurivorum]